MYTPYGRGISSSSLKKKIGLRYEALKKKADTLIPDNAIETIFSKGEKQS